MSRRVAAISGAIQPPRSSKSKSSRFVRGSPSLSSETTCEANIERRLDGQLEGVFDETLLSDVLADPVRLRERAQFAHAGFDLGEFLGDKLRVRQDVVRSSLR